MTPLKIGEETVCTGGVRIRSETENVLQSCVARKGEMEMLLGYGFDSGVVQPSFLLGLCCLLPNRRHWGWGARRWVEVEERKLFGAFLYLNK